MASPMTALKENWSDGVNGKSERGSVGSRQTTWYGRGQERLIPFIIVINFLHAENQGTVKNKLIFRFKDRKIR